MRLLGFDKPGQWLWDHRTSLRGPDAAVPISPLDVVRAFRTVGLAI